MKSLKKVEYNNLEHMVFKLELSKTDILNLQGMKFVDASTTGYRLPPGVNLKLVVLIWYWNPHFQMMLK